MKHDHSGTAVVKVDLPTKEIEELVDKVTDSALVIIGALALAHMFKSIFDR